MIHLTNHFKKIGRHSINRLWFSTNKPQNQNQKIFIDEESIQRKIKEMKQKSQTISTQDKKLKKPKEFMPSFTIPEVNQKVNKFRKQTGTEELFAFSDITFEEKPTILQISGYDSEFIQVDNFEYPPSVILTPNQVLNWEIESAQMLKIQHFAILKCLTPIPDYVIIGVPDASVIKQSLREELRKIHHNMDILNLFEAISQFNTVVDNDKYCIAFMISCSNQ